MPIMGNLLSANDESFETSIGDWATTGNGTVTQVATHGLDGTHSVQVVATAAGDCGITWNTTKIAVTVGALYTLSYWCYTTLTGRSGVVEIDWYNGATYLSDNDTGASPVPLAANTWTFISITAAAVATATACVPICLPVATAASDTFFIDEVFLGHPYDIPGSATHPALNRAQAVSRASLW